MHNESSANAQPGGNPGGNHGGSNGPRPEPPVHNPPPVHEPPVHQPPVHEPPVHEPPVHEPPVQEPPIHQQPPTHEPPPVHEPPVQKPPVQEPPVHQPPVVRPDPPVHNPPPVHEPPVGPVHNPPPNHQPGNGFVNSHPGNPRPVNRQPGQPSTNPQRGNPLQWRPGTQPPQAGKFGEGRPGRVDPGGYIREPQKPSSVITNRDFLRGEIGHIHDHDNIFANCQKHRQGDFHLWPGAWRPRPEWGCGYYNGFWYADHDFDVVYFADVDFCPTEYIFCIETGQFWWPSHRHGFLDLEWGVYVDYLPDAYLDPITISVDEVVAVYDDAGANIIAYETKTFYYNAVWDGVAEAYGYYDYQGTFHWVSFPWLTSWE